MIYILYTITGISGLIAMYYWLKFMQTFTIDMLGTSYKYAIIAAICTIIAFVFCIVSSMKG